MADLIRVIGWGAVRRLDAGVGCQSSGDTVAKYF